MTASTAERVDERGHLLGPGEGREGDLLVVGDLPQLGVGEADGVAGQEPDRHGADIEPCCGPPAPVQVRLPLVASTDGPCLCSFRMVVVPTSL